MLGLLQFLEFGAFDQMVQHQPEVEPDDRILVVGIDEGDIATQGKWPMPDHIMADLLSQLQRHEPKVIGLDLYRNISHPPGQARLRAQLEADNIIVIEQLGGASAVSAPDIVPPERVGFNNFTPDANKVLRRNLIAVDFGNNQYHYSFALRLSLAYLDDLNLPLTFNSEGVHLGSTLFARFRSNIREL